MNFLKRSEIFAFFLLIFFIVVVSYFNFQVSFRRERDNIRRNDLTAVVDALEAYRRDYNVYPTSTEDGKIVACAGPNTIVVRKNRQKMFVKDAVGCDWGKDNMYLDPNDIKSSKLLSPIPQDPELVDGLSYFYISDGLEFQIFAFFEGKDEKEYDQNIEVLGLMCGSKICNVGKTSSGTALDKTL